MSGLAKVTFAPPRPEQIERVAAGLREADRRELAALYGGFEAHLARRLLFEYVALSPLSFAICAGGEVLALTGVMPLAPASGQAYAKTPGPVSGHAPWLLGRAALRGYPFGFMRASRQILALYRAGYAPLQNAVQARQYSSCRYLAALGFRLGPPERLGAGVFRKFYMEE